MCAMCAKWEKESKEGRKLGDQFSGKIYGLEGERDGEERLAELIGEENVQMWDGGVDMESIKLSLQVMASSPVPSFWRIGTQQFPPPIILPINKK